jgi:phosphoserine aminotransferase
LLSGNVVYDFKSLVDSAFTDGFNPPLRNIGIGKNALFSGDVNQDGTIDIFDAQLIENEAASFQFGYNPGDVNGDMSSDIFSKEINVADFDIIYAGAQKNLGPAGATLFIVKDSILGKSTSSFMPTYLDLKQQVEKESMLNTPPVFSVYVAMLNLRNLMANGGVKEMEARNNEKAELLYNEIDANPAFIGTVAKEDRSKMNVTFTLADESRAAEFDALWKGAGIVGLPGHRSTGGYRASMYNALPIESVQVLVEVMKAFGK